MVALTQTVQVWSGNVLIGTAHSPSPFMTSPLSSTTGTGTLLFADNLLEGTTMTVLIKPKKSRQSYI